MPLEPQPPQAVIYCRVSSASQKLSGTGLQSQEHRCRQYAAAQGYGVAAVFPDDASGGGSFMKRPGMVALLSFLDAQPQRRFVVIFDDLKRFARDTQFHIMLRQELSARGATVECLNFKFEDTPEGRFTETIFAAQGELEREQNRRQTIQKMKARVEKGYSVFQAPVGYRYQRDRVHGNILVRDEPRASIIQEALEGYAMGRFQAKAEVQRFLEAHPDFTLGSSKTNIHPQRVEEILTRPIYAGMVEAPSWNVSRRKGHHTPIISYETFQIIQNRLSGKKKIAARVDLNADFPLRGFVVCSDCDKPLTACWSKSKTGKRHPYYWCKTRGCSQHRKSIRRGDLEGAMENVLRTLQPGARYTNLVTTMFHDAWNARLAQATEVVKSTAQAVRKVEQQIETLLNRIVESHQNSVIAAYETRIAKLEEEKLILAERAATPAKPAYAFEEMFELALRFLSNPWSIWEKGDLKWKRTVLKLAFSDPVAYHREEGIRTPKTTLPFKVLEDVSVGFEAMAHP